MPDERKTLHVLAVKSHAAPTLADLYPFASRHGLCVISIVDEGRAPQSALVYYAVTRDLELIFYCMQTTQKALNLRLDPRISVVIGWDGEQTLQYEDIAEEPQFEELDKLKRTFLEVLPDRAGRLGWPGLTIFRVKPSWGRFSNYEQSWQMDELTFPDLHVPAREPLSILQTLNGFIRRQII